MSLVDRKEETLGRGDDEGEVVTTFQPSGEDNEETMAEDVGAAEEEWSEDVDEESLEEMGVGGAGSMEGSY